MNIDHIELKKAIHKSQHCQRNWDLSKEISKDDLDLLKTAATQCPSKQNIAHYNVHFVTNRDIIEKIHDQTKGFRGYQTNSQVLANLLIVLEHRPVKEHKNLFQFDKSVVDNMKTELFLRDAHMAVGVAAGYLNIMATLLGYSTGCCACFNNNNIKEILNLQNDILLMMGIGFKNSNVNRRIHHLDSSFVFPAIKKEEIKVNYYS